jgi:hypothetical protein
MRTLIIRFLLFVAMKLSTSCYIAWYDGYGHLSRHTFVEDKMDANKLYCQLCDCSVPSGILMKKL